MRFWDLSSPEVAAADAEPWDGPLTRLAVRPFPIRTLVWLGFAATILCWQAGAIATTYAQVAGDRAAHADAALLLGLLTIAFGVAIPLTFLALPVRLVRRVVPAGMTCVIFVMGLISTAAVWAVGPTFGIGVVFYFEALPFAFYALRWLWALAATANVVVGCAVVMLIQDGWQFPILQWSLVATTLVAVACIVGQLAERADSLAASEHEARLELADLNESLEGRVADQVQEIERLGELRRFLTPQVADAVMSADAAELTRPHRARIAVFFCDLRGFTAFTRDSEPEEVIADLDQYYRTVGEVLQRHGATIGGYAGDGIMAYIGDPVPHAEPARAAVRMVVELRGQLGDLVAEWERRGHDLSYGIGLAYGYATLGVVGFDGRYDYTPLGGVVNLAARLCGQAGPGQVLMDPATYGELDGVGAGEPVPGLELKGLGARQAYALV
ncbi:adenylate/guanylate cyclase domain-containing protein [Nocardioides stalactiti]|uniref:adenylate/guanylate cyclase domain-containing protein n=1 Tax=Nocardioides stalactiti TaxID=2755356 RepID=UPI001602CA83|nr:adenylate/guanylate cyclase domain-containing protein [Nocardioides stalactiti]